MSAWSRNAFLRLQIDEPWDFTIPGRGNILYGIAEGVCEGPMEKNWRGEYLLTTLPKAFIWQGEAVKQLLISPRYENNTIEDIQNGKEIIVGIARVRANVTLRVSGSFSPQQVEYFAIGSVQKETKRNSGKSKIRGDPSGNA